MMFSPYLLMYTTQPDLSELDKSASNPDGPFVTNHISPCVNYMGTEIESFQTYKIFCNLYGPNICDLVIS